MSLTIAAGPLAVARPHTVNYELSGPKGKLLMNAFDRRVRAVFGGEVIGDTRRGMLLHETGLLPQLYFPESDIHTELLHANTHTTHCPYKGEASYRDVRVGERVAANAVWSYPEPVPEASWLAGYAAIHWGAMDAWWDEDEQVFGHLRDPYHRVDIRPSRRYVRVLGQDAVLAESSHPHVLSETGLPNRYYLPREDVRQDLLLPSGTRTVCPYKGTASYLALSGQPDIAWIYEQPLDDATRIAGRVCFDPSKVTVEVDGEIADR